jgi:hypothetical protein
VRVVSVCCDYNGGWNNSSVMGQPPFVFLQSLPFCLNAATDFDSEVLPKWSKTVAQRGVVLLSLVSAVGVRS